MSTQGPRYAPRVLAVGVAALLLSLLGALAAPVPWSDPVHPLVLVLLAAGFAATELRVLHVQLVGRHTRSISLSEVPLLLGLVFVGPVGVLAGKSLGSLAVFLFHRRPPLKIAVNLLGSLAESLVALAAFAAVLQATGRAEGPSLWLAGFAGTTAACLVSHVVVYSAISYSQGRRPAVPALLHAAMVPVATSTVVTTLALVAVHALHDDRRSAVLLSAVGLVVLSVYRGYAELVERHRALEQLHAFSRVVSVTRHPDEVLRSVLEQARELLQADHAAVRLLGADGDDDLLVALGADGLLVRRSVAPVADPGGPVDTVLQTGRPLLVPRDTHDERLAGLLRSLGRRDAVLAPLPGESSAVGTLLAADRLGDLRTFGRDDVRLLETVAHHASAALLSGRLLERLQHDAAHDALTGLPNRAGLLTAAAEAMDSGAPVALVLLDLDGFKQVNDCLGHGAGDTLLRSTAERLLGSLPEGALAARLGGDEFALLLTGPDHVAGALEVARSVRAAVSVPLTVHGMALSISASVGMALAPEHATDADTLLQAADLALSEARALSDLDVRVFSAAPGSTGPERLALAADLREALADRSLQVHVQPKALLGSGEVVGVEALVRWQHPRLGPLAPDSFIALAEQSGLIVPLTSHVLETSIREAARWHRAGDALSIAVNLSPRSLADEAVVDEVLGLLAQHDLPAHLLTLEVTEGSVIAEPERAQRILLRLREAGVRLSLDDFGTGYSSLTHLKRLPVHEVKIDRSFVRDMASDDEDAAIVRSIVDLGLNLRLEVVAEGVEDGPTWDLLTALGCDLVQGYFLSRPLPLADFPAWLAGHRAATAAALVPAPRAAGGVVLGGSS